MSNLKKTKFELAVIDKVTKMRMEKGLSQFQIATALGVSSGFIGQVESHTHTSKYNLNHLNRLAHLMECSVKDFIPDAPILEDNWDEY